MPVSVTAVTRETIDAAGIRLVSEAAILAPNTMFTEWTARKLSNARFRGISSSPNNPAITTYIDGVPQLNANSSSIELLDVDQIEFVRGPQSALFGRNTLGGLVNVDQQPAVDGGVDRRVDAAVRQPRRVDGARRRVGPGDRGHAGGRLLGRAGEPRRVHRQRRHRQRHRFAVRRSRRRARCCSSRTSNWEARVIVSGERARDGDYGLNDVAALRANPFHAARDFEGFANRDIFGTTIHVRRTGGPLVFSSTTGIVKWTTQDVTDLDYTPQPLIQRDNTEEDLQFTQELRVASSEQSPIQLSDSARLRWQAGVFFFTQGYEQDAVNSFSPFLVAPFPVSQHSPRSALDDHGVGLFGQATVTLGERFDLSAGARFDHESKDATLETFYEPQIAPPSRVDAEKGFSSVSPQVAAAWRLSPEHTLYATVGRGFKAGGFNSASPARQRSLRRGADVERRGRHQDALGGRPRLGQRRGLPHRLGRPAAERAEPGGAGAVLHLERRRRHQQWRRARARGTRRPWPRSVRRLRLHPRAVRRGQRLRPDQHRGQRAAEHAGPTHSASARSTRGWWERASLVGRVDVVRYGEFQYDDANSLGQEAYSLVHLRGGYTARRWLAEVFVRNAFDTAYIPLALPYPNFAPSGFLGEMGAPRTFGASIGVRF